MAHHDWLCKRIELPMLAQSHGLVQTLDNFERSTNRRDLLLPCVLHKEKLFLSHIEKNEKQLVS